MLLQAAPPSGVVMARIVDQTHETGLADVLIGSLGLSGALVAFAILIGLLFGAVLVLRHKLFPDTRSFDEQHPNLTR